jgi:phenylpyruvate tautomerase PptA (4-oxalocrotonate tautomerase family)
VSPVCGQGGEDGNSLPVVRLEETIMAPIQIELMEEIFTAIQKKELVDKLANAFVVINGKKMRSAAWMSMEEICNGEWRIG